MTSPPKPCYVRLYLGGAILWAKEGGGWTPYMSERRAFTEAEAEAMLRRERGYGELEVIRL